MTQTETTPTFPTFSDAAADVARQVAALVEADEPVVFSYEPGDMTCYEIAICRPTRRPASVDDRHDGPTVRYGDHVVSIVNFGTSYAFTFDPDVREQRGPLHPDYVAEKIGRGNPHTGSVVAEVLNAIVDEVARITADEQESR